jgi:hypothetical protein
LAIACERVFHEEFAIKKIIGEWFYLNQGDVAYIRLLANILGRIRQEVIQASFKA